MNINRKGIRKVDKSNNFSGYDDTDSPLNLSLLLP